MATNLLVPVLAGILSICGALQDSDAEEKSIRALIEQWGEEDLSRRNAATGMLRARGRQAWPLLRAAGSHPDPEIRIRSAELLREQQLRRQLPYSVLERHPDAVETLRADATAEKHRLIRTLGQYYAEFRDLLHSFLEDPDPDMVLTTAEVLYENHDRSWIPNVLEMLPQDYCPRPARAAELLSSVSSSIPPALVQSLFDSATEEGKVRLLELSNGAAGGLGLRVSAGELRTLLETGETRAVRAGLSRLREWADPALTVAVLERLEDGREEVVADALYTLRRTRTGVEPRRLLPLLRHDSLNVREEAAQLAVQQESQDLIEGFRGLLEDPSVSLRRLALQALWNLLGDRSLADLERVFLRDTGESQDLALDLILRHPEHAVRLAGDFSASPGVDRRLRGAELLLRLEGAGTLERWAKDPDEALRRWAFDQSLSAESGLCGRILHLLAADPSESLRFDVCKALARRGDVEAVQVLRRLALEEGEYRIEALEVMLSRPAEESLLLARELLRSQDTLLQRMALRALDDHGSYDGIDRAAELLTSGDRRLRTAALQYLQHAAARGRAESVVPKLAVRLTELPADVYDVSLTLVTIHVDATCLAALRRVVQEEKPGSDRALRALALWAGEKATDVLMSCLTPEDRRIRDVVCAAVDLVEAREGDFSPQAREGLRRELREGRLFGCLLTLLQSPSAATRRHAIECLTSLEADRGVRSIRERMCDEDAGVRHAAVRALVRFRDVASVPGLMGMLDDEDPEIRVASAAAVSLLSPGHRRRVEECLSREDCPWVRRKMEGILTTWPTARK